MLFDQEFVKVQEGFRGIASVKLNYYDRQTAWFDTDEGEMEVSAYSPGTIRLRILKQNLPDYGLLASPSQSVGATFKGGPEIFRIQSGSFTLEIQAQPHRIRIFKNEHLLVESVTDRTIQGDLRFHPFAFGKDEWLVSLALRSGEAIYGLGEKFGPLNRRGQLITSWNRDATGVNAEISYKNAPFAWSTEGWGLFVNTPARVIHGVGYAPWSHRTYILKVQEANLDLFFIMGESPGEILERYTWLTGRAPLPPRWSYGTWFSRAYYKTADEILSVARKLRERRIPCDVITLDGRAWHIPEQRFDFSWDPERYPDPASFVRQLKELDLRLCLWEYPYLSTRNPRFAELEARKFFLRNADGTTCIYRWFPPPVDNIVSHLQPSAIYDFTNPEAYAWFCESHKALFEIGVAVMKPDYGEAVPEQAVGFNGDSGARLHNVYALLYNRCVFEASQKYSDGMVWSRSGWTGSQRYPIQWGGDSQGDWEGLAGSIRGGLSWGMSGAPFYAHDIGGFHGSQSSGGVIGEGMPDPELYIRWMQAGVLSSHTRFHGTSPREPWEFGQEVEDIVRSWLGFRYQLIPYLQECAEEANRSGMPLMRAMPLAFPDEALAWNFETQYMLGPALLVAPVLRPGGQVKLYLPTGIWYDLWTGVRLKGPQMLDLIVALDRTPIYGRAGYSLGLGPAVQHTGELKGEIPINRIHFEGEQIRQLRL